VFEVINAVEKVVGKKVPVEMSQRREGDPAELVAANAMALSTLGWKPKITAIEEIVESAWKWHLTL